MTGGGRSPVFVAGGGAVGLTIALDLARSGRSVTVFDPAEIGDNASGVAAGMLAPLSEALGTSASAFSVLRGARNLWKPLAERLGLDLDMSGAVHIVARGEAQERLQGLASLGGLASLVATPAWLDTGHGDGEAVFTPEDWRIDPLEALITLQRTYLAAGGEWVSEALPSSVMRDAVQAQVVIAAGWDAHALACLAPEVARLSPIKGQILRLDGGPRDGPVIRAGDVYLVPDRGGLIVGATMEVGVADCEVDPVQAMGLHAKAAGVSAGLEGLTARAAAGVRATTPDGWPLVGPSVREGVWLAVGARRNGWLLAPLIADVLMARMRGEDGGEIGRMMDPRRFD